MNSFPLFDVHELTQAFTLILPDKQAGQVATEWFARFGDNLDPQGRFCYTPRTPRREPQKISDDIPMPVPPGARGSGLEKLRNSTFDEFRQYLLRFSSFHMGLVALVSPDLERRVRLCEALPDDLWNNFIESIRHNAAEISHR